MLSCRRLAPYTNFPSEETLISEVKLVPAKPLGSAPARCRRWLGGPMDDPGA